MLLLIYIKEKYAVCTEQLALLIGCTLFFMFLSYLILLARYVNICMDSFANIRPRILIILQQKAVRDWKARGKNWFLHFHALRTVSILHSATMLYSMTLAVELKLAELIQCRFSPIISFTLFYCSKLTQSDLVKVSLLIHKLLVVIH